MSDSSQQHIARYEQWEIERQLRIEAIDDKYTVEGARSVCESFALGHGVRFVEDGQCGFGRPCVGFSDAEDKWVQYNPADFKKLMEASWEDALIIDSGEVSAPEGVEAYHKSDYLCVLKTECDTNLVKYLGTVFGALGGSQEAVDKALAEPDAEIPSESTNRAIKQMAHWIETLAERGEISIVKYKNGNESDTLQAAFEGTENHAIVVTPRT